MVGDYRQGSNNVYKKRVLFTGLGTSEPNVELMDGMKEACIIVNDNNEDFIVEPCITDLIQNLNCKYKKLKGIIIDWQDQIIEIYTTDGYEVLRFKIFSPYGIGIISSISGNNIHSIHNSIYRNMWNAIDWELFFEEPFKNIDE